MRKFTKHQLKEEAQHANAYVINEFNFLTWNEMLPTSQSMAFGCILRIKSIGL